MSLRRQMLLVYIVPLTLVAIYCGIHAVGRLLSLPFALPNWSYNERMESITIGKRLVGKITEYRAKTGRYPEKLADLVPEYLSAVPDPVAGEKKWRYEVTTYRFYLQFSAPSGYPHYCYDPNTNEWYQDN